jgi:hypothetical protein
VGLVLSALTAAPVSAATPTDIFISEYVDGSNPASSAIELFNGTASSVNLATGLYSLMIYADGAAQPSTTINLTGTIASNDVIVLVNGQAPPALAAYQDQLLGTLSWTGNDAIVLRKNGTAIDRIGQLGSNPGVNGWGLDPTNTTDNTLRRKATVTAGDANTGAAFDPAVEWDGYAVDTFSGLGAHTIDTGTQGGGGATTGTVDAHVDVATSAACVELSTTSISFGTLPLGAQDEPATPNVVVTNCSSGVETVFAKGTDATALGATWTLTDAAATCADMLGIDHYRLGIFSMNNGAPIDLSTANKPIDELQTYGQAASHTARIYTACPGSSGSGMTMTMHIDYLVTT